ncbi:MAG: hypothetical protein IPP78_05765 [Holophagaceae bacterium]|nr:hypothetical protein [Holophagaceae bacterium]
MTEARPRIQGDLARRLDRLSLAAHRFHRFAHHPLCAEYEGEVFRFGRKLRICKGCTLAGIGVLAGLAAGGIAPKSTGGYFAGIAFGLVPLLTGAFHLHARREAVVQPAEGSSEAMAISAAHRLPSKRGKLLTRLTPAAVFAFTFAQGLRTGGVIGYAGATLAVPLTTLIILAYRRRRPQRQPCLACPERFAMHRCRGFREIRSRERAFQRLAGRLIQWAK